MIPDPADYLVVAMTALYRLYLAADAGRLVVRGLAAARVNGDEVVAARNRIVEHEFKMAVLHLQHARVVASISLRSAFMLRFLSPSALVASCRHYSTTCCLVRENVLLCTACRVKRPAEHHGIDIMSFP